MNRALAYSLRLCLTVSFRPELPLNTCNKSSQHKTHKITLWAGEVIERKHSPLTFLLNYACNYDYRNFINSFLNNIGYIIIITWNAFHFKTF